MSVAQPAIQQDLGLTPSGLAWVVNAYLIPFGGLLLLTGRLGDLLGRKRMFLAGLGVFTVASLLCGLARGEQALVAARALQGAGGAMTSAVILGMIVALFPKPAERGRAITTYAFVGSAGASLGTVLGGVLTDLVSWHWIFFVNVPIGVATGVAAVTLLAPETGPGLRRGADAPGAVLIVTALSLAVFAIVGAEAHGLGSARTLGLGALALALLAAFALREARAAQPLVPPRILRVGDVAAANLVQTVATAGMFGQQFLVALYLGLVLGYGPVLIGVGMVPIALTIGVVSLGFAARLMGRFGAKRILLAGLALVAFALALMARVPVEAVYPRDVLPALLLLGIGAGLAMPAISTLAMSGPAPEDAGVASGLANTTQQVGAALGLAILATVAAGRCEDRLAAGAPPAQALTSGYRLGFAVAAGLALVALALAAALLRPRR